MLKSERHDTNMAGACVAAHLVAENVIKKEKNTSEDKLEETMKPKQVNKQEQERFQSATARSGPKYLETRAPLGCRGANKSLRDLEG